MKQKKFFSTINKGTDKINDILVGATFLHANKDKDLAFFSKAETMPNKFLSGFSLKMIPLLLKSLFSAVFSPGNVSIITYKNVSVGRYAVSSAYRSYDAYNSRVAFIHGYLKSIFRCAQIIESIEPYKMSIDSAFIDHGCYQNGVYFDVFSRLGIAIYLNDYPFGLVRWEPKVPGGYDAALQIDNYSIGAKDIAMGKSALDARTNDSGKISYLSVEFDAYHSGQEFDYVIYTHSFTDAQSMYGYDGAFNNVMEWLEFTLSELSFAKVCIKAHPGIYIEGHSSQVVDWDRQLFSKLVVKYRDKSNIHIIDYAITNIDLLNSIGNETILVSHHSNALLEGGGLGFKCICAQAGNWTKFSMFNTWSDKYMYQALLGSSYEELKETDKTELFTYYFILNFGEASFFRSHWFEEVAEIAGVDYKGLFVDASCVEGFSPTMIGRCVERIAAKLVTR